MKTELRPYQKEAVLAVLHAWRDGHQKTLLVMPTGTGKTIVFAAIAGISAEHKQRVLVIAHRKELLDQAAAKIEHTTGIPCALEKAENTAVGSNARIVIASMQTLTQESRLTAYAHDAFQVIIVDEAHHALSPSYQRIFSYFSNAFLLGVTATAERGDKKELGIFFDSLAYEYTLPEAVASGYLVPMKAVTIPLKLDLTHVKIQNGDYQPGEIGSVLEPYLTRIAQEMRKVCLHRRTIVFLPLIRISKEFTALLNKEGFRAAEVNGESEDRDEVIQDFMSGKYNVICNSMLLTEGFDCPSIDCVVVLRPTQVRGLYAQMIGRGTRLYPGKKDLLILDFLWMTEKHDLCRPAQLLSMNEEIAERVTNMLSDGKEMDLAEASAQAERDILEERRKALALELRRQKDRQRQVLDSLQVGILLHDTKLMDYEPSFRYELEPPTEKQLTALGHFGMDTASITSKGQAALYLKKLVDRRNAGLSTLKQIRFLESRDFRNVSQWSFEDANEMMKRISANNWNLPIDVDPKTYIPEHLRSARHKQIRKR